MHMHPYLSALLAAERVKDMQEQGSRGRRARVARRARRGADVMHVPDQIRSSEPCLA